jgi:hypothetical protein
MEGQSAAATISIKGQSVPAERSFSPARNSLNETESFFALFITMSVLRGDWRKELLIANPMRLCAVLSSHASA